MRLLRDLWATSPHRTALVVFLIVFGGGGQAAASALAGPVLLHRSTALFLLLSAALAAAVLSDLAVGLLAAGLTADWSADVRRRLCRVALGQDLPALENTPVGELLDRIDGDVYQVASELRGSGVRIVQALAVGVLSIFTTLLVWWPAGTGMLVLSVVLVFGLKNRALAIGPARMGEEEAWSDLAAVMEEAVHGQDDVRTTLARPYVLRLYASRASRVLARGRRVWRMSAQVTTVASGATRTGIACVVVGGGWALATGRIDGARLTAVWLLALAFGGMVEHISRHVPHLQYALGAWGRVQQLAGSRQEPSGGALPTDGDLAVRDLTFRYPERHGDRPDADGSAPRQAAGDPAETVRDPGAAPGKPPGAVCDPAPAPGDPAEAVRDPGAAPGDPADAPVDRDGAALRGVNLSFTRGRSYALVGRTGSGKSTLAKILTRAVDVPRGAVFLDGTDLLDLDVEALRRWIAVVPQRTEILAGTLAENIALFDPELLAPAAEALRELGLSGWAEDLPDGMRTRLGEGGYVLSAGQEQLVAFARILVRDPHVVILDEATARMDPVTEAQVQRATERLLTGRIGVVIAHRLSSVRRCDEVVVLADGEVVEAGPLHRSRRFARLLAAGNAALPDDPADGGQDTGVRTATWQDTGVRAATGHRTGGPATPGQRAGHGSGEPVDAGQRAGHATGEPVDAGQRAGAGYPGGGTGSGRLGGGAGRPVGDAAPESAGALALAVREDTGVDAATGRRTETGGPAVDGQLTVPPKGDPPPLPEPPPARTLREIFRLVTNDPRYGLLTVLVFVLMLLFGLDGVVLPWLWADLVDGSGELFWPVTGLVFGLLVGVPTYYFSGAWYPEWWNRQMLRISARLVHGQTGPRRVSPHTPAEVVAQGGDTERVVLLADNLIDQGITVMLAVAMTVISGSVVPALFFAGTVVLSGAAATLFGPLLERSARKTVAARAAFATALVSSLSAARTVKLAGATRPVLAHLARLDRVRSDRQRREISVQVWARSTPAITSGLLPIAVWAVYLSGAISAGAALVAVSTLGAARWFAWTTASLISQFPSARVWTRRTVSMAGIGAYSASVDGVDLSAGTAPGPPALPRHPLDRMDLIGFSAVHEDGTVGVRDVDLTIERGQLVLVVGPVGSGKSSLLRALAGIVHHTGELRWNGRPVTEPELFLRPNQVGYVAQLPRVLSGTIADNIRLGHEVDAASAVSTAQLDHDLDRAGGGLGLVIGHKGTRLSGGQLQRLALARALAPRTELLIADDVSSALDVDTEMDLWRALRRHGVTVVGSTSKRAALAQADLVVVLVGGTVAARGSWRQLSEHWGHLSG